MTRRLGLLFCLVFCSSISAGEGVFHINQACASIGCFEGDIPGWPVTLVGGKSYRLTSDLQSNSIAITSGNEPVTIDLNGFEIRGPVLCDGTPVVSCSLPEGTSYGIYAGGPATIKNGAVNGFRGGVFCPGNCVIEDLLVAENAWAGLTVGITQPAQVRRVRALRNGQAGIYMYYGRIDASMSSGNGEEGLRLGVGSAYVAHAADSHIQNNAGTGIRCLGACQLLNNSVSGTAVRVEFELPTSSWGGNALRGFDSNSVIGAENALVLSPNTCNGAFCP